MFCTFARDLLVGNENAVQRAAPARPRRLEQSHGLDHRRQRTFRVARPAAEELAIALPQHEWIARPPLARRDNVHVRVESEDRACLILQGGNDVRASGFVLINLDCESPLSQKIGDEARCLELAPRRIFRPEGDEPR